MELMFNELSVQPLSLNKFDAIEKVKQFALTFSDARKRGFIRIRSHYHYSEIILSKDYSIQDFLFDKTISSKDYKNYKDILFGNIVQPFINEEDEEIENAYIQSSFHYNNSGIEQNCLGLSAAFFYETLCISLNSSTLWRMNLLTISNVQNKATVTEQVNNIFSKDCFNIQSISDFIENLGKVELIISKIKIEDKKIHLASHHGKKELNKLCNRIKHNDFVIEMRSTNWGGKDFIRKINKDGVVEIVLVNSQREYALWVQTTGRNYRETKAIAEKLREKYS